ncbi:sigma-54-dependent transcriptional regulator [Celeribacter sp.]|uniref:sigma-54-dependent transcriptional regulator n=1 Tax=Celeribacter sp. TaxID=1890673 RepID=UPI003A8DBE83
MTDQTHKKQDMGQEAGTAFGPDLAKASVLVVDDELGMRHFLKKALSTKCRHVDVAATPAEASAYLDGESYDVIMLDNIMPGMTGLEWLADQWQIGLRSDIILMTAYADLDTAIEALRLGISDFLLKPFHSNQVLNAISKSLAKTALKRQNTVLRQELAAGSDLLRQRDTFVGSSQAAQTLRDTIERAAQINAPVVIEGETGTGKHIAARMLHSVSPRAHKPFAWLPCFGISFEDFRERLFGRVDRSVSSGEGILNTAEGGVLFLEDVDLLPPAGQNLLVEWLSTGRFQPVGGGRSFQTDIRVVCCSKGNMKQAVEDGSFRTDLFYLLNVHEVWIPPLRERPSDVIEIAEFFLTSLSARMGAVAPDISASDKRRLMAHDWPGNVMELRNVVERAIIQGGFERALQDVGSTETESLEAVEQRHILNVLQACGGNKAEAARILGVARKTIDRKCQAWGL